MSETDKKWMALAKRWGVLFGIPLLMLAIGIWQWSRADTPVTDVSAQIAEYQQVVRQLEAIEAEKPGRRATVRDSEGKEHPVWKVKNDYLMAIKDLQNQGLNVTTRNLQPVLAGCTIAFSVLALLWSALGVVYQRGMGAKAMQSREQLLATFQKGRKLLPTYMVVMVLLLFGAAIPLLVYEMMPILRHRNYSKGDMKLMFILGGLALFLLYSGCKVLVDVWKASRKPLENEPIDVMGQTVSRQQAPELWAFVDSVAAKTGAGLPDTLVVGLNEGFFVTEHPVQLASGALLPQGRVLYLPLPYLAFLNAGEVAAVIGHELGHFIGEDTLYSQRFSPIYSATIHHLVAISGGERYEESWMDILRRPATLFGEMFLDSFHEAVRYWSRKRELAADGVGAQVVSPQAVASSLLRISALAPLVEEALQANWDRGETVEGGVLGHVRQLVAAKGMTDPSEHLDQRQAHPTDTHPELAERLAALGVPVSPELLARAMDAQGSPLLQEFGLEQGAPAAGSRTLAGAVAPAAVVDMNAALQNELSSAAAANRSAKLVELREIAALATPETVIHERSVFMMGLFCFLALACFGGAVALFIAGLHTAIGAGVLAGGVVCLWVARLFWRDGQSPAMVLQPAGVRLFNAQQLLPWSAIDDFQFNQANHMLTVIMALEPGVQPPAMGVGKRRAQFQKKKQRVVVMLKGVKKMKNQAFAELLVNQWRAYYARQELARMGEQA